jgi:hypothetical protein
MPTNPSALEWRKETVLIIGRATPEPSKKHLETVCTGGITDKGEVVRLYPISWRYLEQEKRYKQWTWAEFEIAKDPSDKRKESYKVREGSIRIIGQCKDWSERFSILNHAVARDKETLIERYKTDWTSIGVVEIEPIEFYVQAQKKNWDADKSYIKQFLLYTDRKPLEQLPIEMRLKFKCKNNPVCSGHDCSIIGWEYMEAFRNFRNEYGSAENAVEVLKDAFKKRFADKQRNPYVLMGTHRLYPSWMVAQVYFIPKDLQPRLF